MFFPGFLVSIPKVSKYILVYVINSNVSLKISLSRFHFTTESDRSIVSSNVYFIVSWSTSNTDSYNLLCIRACNYTPVYTINCDKRRLLRHRSCSCACDIPYAMKNEKKGKESLVE